MVDASKQKQIDAIKQAIMVEIKGQQLYEHAAMQSEDPAAKAMFESLAQEENHHVHILEVQYNRLMEGKPIDISEVHPGEVDHGSGDVIDENFRKSLKRGRFEMAVIGIGCDLENKAIAYYKEQAELAEDADLKQLFTWLVDWEVGHLKQLMELEKITQDEFWSDSGFAPM